MAFGKPVIQMIDGNPVEFPKIFVSDYEALFEIQRALKKAKIERSVKEQILTKDEGRQMLIALADASENIFEIQDSYSDPKMMRAILERSWKKTAKPMSELEQILTTEDPDLLASIAARVTRREASKPEAASPTDPKDSPGPEGASA